MPVGYSKGPLFRNMHFNPQLVPPIVLFIFFAGPKKTNQKKRPFFEGVWWRVLPKPSPTAIKSEPISDLFISQGLFMATLTKKMDTYPRLRVINHHAFLTFRTLLIVYKQSLDPGKSHVNCGVPAILLGCIEYLPSLCFFLEYAYF